jgi:hypothetical protein
MDRLLRGTGIVLVCALALASSAASFSSGLRARVLSDLFTHISYGEKGLEEGRWQVAVAHSDAVLLPSIKVFVDYGDIGADRRTDCLAAIQKAFVCWREGTSAETEFALVDNAAEANVQISFVPQLSVNGRPAGGYTQWRRSVKISGSGDCTTTLTATMQFALNQPGGKPMNVEQMRQAAAHEFGHILGLQDSSHRGDVMGPLDLGKPAVAPQVEETQALLEIREEARRLRARASAQGE